MSVIGANADVLQDVPVTAFARQFWLRAAATAGTRAVLVSLGVLTGVVTARALGPEGLGVLTVMFTLGALGVQLGHLGLPSAVTYFVAADRTRLPALLGGSLVAALGVGTLLALLLFLVLAAFPALSPLQDHGLLAIALAWIPPALLSLMLLNLALGLQRMRLYNGMQLVQSAAALSVVLGLVLVDHASPLSFYHAAFGALLLATAILLLPLLRLATWRITLPDAALARGAAGYGLRAYVALLLSFTVLKLDLLMVGRMLGAEPAGHYSIAAAAGELVTLPFAALGAVLFANVASAAASWSFARDVAIRSALALVPLLLMAALLARPAITFVFGADYLPAAPALLLLLPGLYCLAVNTVLMHYFAGIGMPAITMVGPGVASAVNVVLNLVWLPRYGIAGAALASSVAYALMLASSIVYLRARRPG